MEIEIEGNSSEYMNPTVSKIKTPPPPTPPEPRTVKNNLGRSDYNINEVEEKKGITNAERFWLTIVLGALFYANLYVYNNWQHLEDAGSIEFLIILYVFGFDLLTVMLLIINYEPIERFNKWLNSKEI